MKNFCLNTGRATGLAAAATALLLNACAPSQDAPAPAITINISRYVAVGDSYTAGLSAGGLTRTSQEYSFPNLLAQQLGTASGGAAFTQPYLEAGTGSGYLTLAGFTPAGFAQGRRVTGQAVRGQIINTAACAGADTVRLLTRSSTSGTLPQNLGIPGLQLSQIETAGYGNAATATPGSAFNPYFERLLPAGDNRTYLQAVSDAANSATFFTYFQGLDDLMPFVRSGGECAGLDVASTSASSAARTLLQNTMNQNAKKILDRLTANSRMGIIARLPTLPTLPLLRSGKGDVLEKRLQVFFGDTAHMYIQASRPNVPSPARAIAGDDYVLATALARIGKLTPVVVGGTTLMLPYGRDSRNPVFDADVLDSRELNLIGPILNNYNNTLETLSATYNLPIINLTNANERTLDLNLLFSNVADNIAIAGVQYTPEAVRGSFFSVDYYTLTPRGNGVLANNFILAINKAYRANIPAIDVNKLPTYAQ